MGECWNLQRAVVHQSRRLPVIWAIPIIALAIGVWLAWETLSKEGPTIVVSFEDAEGLQVGQSQLKFKDITLGTVKSLAFAKDHRRVLVSIATTAQADPFLTTGTPAWVHGGVIRIGRPGMDHVAWTDRIQQLLRVARVRRVLHRVEVIEVTEELVEPMNGGQELIEIAEVVLAELARGIPQ